MPHAVFFTKRGHAIHGTTEVKHLGRPASHGCVRLAPANAKTLFYLVKDAGLENTQVVLTGVATSAGVESTARAAHEHGYHVVVATDAMTDRSAEVHANSVERIFPRLGETATTAEILAGLEHA